MRPIRNLVSQGGCELQRFYVPVRRNLPEPGYPRFLVRSIDPFVQPETFTSPSSMSLSINAKSLSISSTFRWVVNV